MEFKKTNHPGRPRPDISPQRNVRPVAPPRVEHVDTDNDLAAEPAPVTRKRRFVFGKKTTILTGVVIVVAVAGFVGLQYRRPGAPEAHAISGEPEYQTVLPDGKRASELGGWKRISPPGKDPVFAYADKIGQIPVSVSEQPLPTAFKDNIDDQMASLAEKFSATDKLDAAGTTVYVGTSVKGPQSALFAKDGLLIMIKSEKKISDAAWKSYAASLR